MNVLCCFLGPVINVVNYVRATKDITPSYSVNDSYLIEFLVKYPQGTRKLSTRKSLTRFQKRTGISQKNEFGISQKLPTHGHIQIKLNV